MIPKTGGAQINIISLELQQTSRSENILMEKALISYDKQYFAAL